MDKGRSPENQVKRALAWLMVGIPMAWGLAQVLEKSAALFR